MTPTLFESERMHLDDSIELTVQSMLAYGPRYEHWAIAFSGGKDSTCVVTLIMVLILSGRIKAPKTLTVLYADTRMELPPLQHSAMLILRELEKRGISVRVVLPPMDERFFVYMFGRGVPPPKNRFRWCTSQIKIEPMLAALASLRAETGAKLLMLTGVRIGESAQRDQRIALSCGRDGAECGQGWFQEATPESVADTLAPILHWRVCHVWDWLYLHAPMEGFATSRIAEVYGGDEAQEINARTGCVGCNLASRDTALEVLIQNPNWSHLSPLRGLKPLYAELKRPLNRLRKPGDERRVDGSLVKNPMRLGPLTMAAREIGITTVLKIQNEVNHVRPAQQFSLINDGELSRIRELMAANTWPDGWRGDEPNGGELLDEVLPDGSVQKVLFIEDDSE